tara:strand:- start:3915 stop:5162 length:1248 start_codon:yes stop_codon:yes gene_type:complete
MYKIVDLFSGIGGFSYAAEQIVGGFETIAFVERDEYCQKVLRKHWHDVPIYSDIRSFNGKEYKDADIVVGGFPCQPWSVAGSQRGSEDDRDLWHEMVRIIEDIRPRWVIGENVSGFVTMPMGLRRSLSDLESIGYKAIPYLIPAAAVDAKHRRMRCWVVGHTEHNGSSATSFRRGDNQIDGGSTQGTNKASEFEGASGQEDNGYIQTDIFDLVANTNPSNGGNRAHDENIGDKKGNSSKAGRESLQSENRQTRSSNSESSSQSLANTNDKGLRTRINGSDNDLQKEGRGGGDDRTTSRADVGLHVKTSKNGEMELSEKGDVPYTNCKRSQGLRQHTELERKSSKNESSKKGIQGSNGADFRREPITWQPEPNVGRVAHGVSNRVHRLRCLGNSIVPQVVARIFYAIKEADNDSKI